MVAYLMAVDRGQRDFDLQKIEARSRLKNRANEKKRIIQRADCQVLLLTD
jgi:hypothetical protein